MTSIRTLEQGIQAIQANQKDEGRRLIRIAIKDKELSPQLRAVAYLWLAEAMDDFENKRLCYSEALIAEPTNVDAQQRLSNLLASRLPPVPPAPSDTLTTPPPSQYASPVAMSYQSTPAPQPSTLQPVAPLGYAQMLPYSANVSDHIVGILGGPNGLGTGFFVSEQGIIATTRFVIGGMERLTIELRPGQQVQAQVVRAFPDIDLAFVRLEYAPQSVLPILPQERVADDAPLIAYPYNQPPIQGAQRPTKRALAAHWVSTTFTNAGDAGGAPIFNQHQYLIGMATLNTSRNSGHFYVLHITTIRARLQAYFGELQSEPRMYCPSCGTTSRSGGAGFYYCDQCGGTFPRAVQIAKSPLPQAEYFYGISGIKCTQCGAQSGFYDGKCLRCGQSQAIRA